MHAWGAVYMPRISAAAHEFSMSEYGTECSGLPVQLIHQTLQYFTIAIFHLKQENKIIVFHNLQAS